MSITLADRTTSFAAATVEREALEIGRNLFAEVGRGPSIRERGWWDDRVMDLTMGDPEIKVQLFRFIDALPSLATAEDVGGRGPGGHRQNLPSDRTHRRQSDAQDHEPGDPARHLAEVFAEVATHMARKFIASSTPLEAFESVKNLRRRGVGFTRRPARGGRRQRPRGSR